MPLDQKLHSEGITSSLIGFKCPTFIGWNVLLYLSSLLKDNQRNAHLLVYDNVGLGMKLN